jgi:hypothetical protein
VSHLSHFVSFLRRTSTNLVARGQHFLQPAITQTNRRRAERLKLSANRHPRTFPNLTIPYGVRVRFAIGKNDEAGNTRARLNHQLALSVSLDALLNRSRNFYDRADDERFQIIVIFYPFD